jgi:membrane-bound lytic murein transglycosylase D
VRRGDTLVTIADRFGVSLGDLRRWNKISGIRVAAGRRLYVAQPRTASRSSHARRRGASAKPGASASSAPKHPAAHQSSARGASSNR